MATQQKPELHVTLLPPASDEQSQEAVHELISAEETFNDVLALYMPDSWAQSCSILACFELEDGSRIYLSDLSAPVSVALSALPKPSSHVIFTFTYTPTDDTPTQRKPHRSSLQRLGGLVKRVVLVGIKTVVVLELIGFGLSRARLIRHLGRRARWGPRTSEWESSDSSEAIGTSSDMAELLLDYLEGDADAKDFEGVSADDVVRGIKKITPADLKELNLDDMGEHQAMEQLQSLATRLEAKRKSTDSTKPPPP